MKKTFNISFVFVIFFTIALIVGVGCQTTESLQIGAGMSENTCPDMGADYPRAGESELVCYYYDMTTPEMQMIEITK